MTYADLSPWANHLWQSTVFAGAMWALTLPLRQNRAAVRYWLWLAASVKFLIPFSLLVNAGSQLGRRAAAVSEPPQWFFVAGRIGQPFNTSAAAPQAVAPPSLNPVPAVLFGIWLCGVAVGIVFWLRCWRRMRTARRAATPLALGLPIPVLSSSARVEPGVFGIREPVLLLPEGIMERLTPAQLAAIVTHEMCHVRRRDNLTATIHMLVEVLFWFYPLLWWIRGLLVEEREHACDEEGLRSGSDASVYAEGILSVCKLYLESPLVCLSGVTGADLKKRIAEIMNPRNIRNLSYGKRILLAAAAYAAVAGPIVVGFVRTIPVEAQTAPSPRLEFEVASVKRWVRTGRGMNVGVSISGPRVTISAMGLTGIIEHAYNLKPYQISGGPAWIESERYDIAAKVEGESAPSMEQVHRMLQTLLADRFQLRHHRETREMPVYALVAGKNGPKLKESSPGTEESFGVTGKNGLMQMTVAHGNMEQLALQLSSSVERPVIDKTGLTGYYDYKLSDLAPANATAPDSNGESVFTALQEQLGLKLEPQKGPVTMFLIDHVEKPSEN